MSMVVLAIFMVLTAVGLERAVVKRALQAEEDALQLLIYSLLAAVDRDASGLGITVTNNRLFETDLLVRNSGLYALLYDRDKREIWRSGSTTADLPGLGAIELGEWQFGVEQQGETPYFQLGFALQWPDINNELQRYEVVAWRDAVDYFEQRDRFRQTLWAWLLITTVLLLLLMYSVSRWSLRPLQKIGLEVKAIEESRQTGFEQEYPSEITPLTENLNILLKREQYQRQRYRNALDDLAHSLKTPLAVLTGLTDQANLDRGNLETLREQTERMNQIVSYQLQKTSHVGEVAISKPLDLVGVVEKLLSALEKVYREKGMRVDCDLPEQMLLRIDEGDCLEIVGNLLDNAFKYGRSRIWIRGVRDEGRSISLTIADDGQGLEPEAIEPILNRGTRLDENAEGQGIGLAVVADIVESYNIALDFDRSEAGGLSVRLLFKSG